jgi:AraC-like DNA-binding protein
MVRRSPFLDSPGENPFGRAPLTPGSAIPRHYHARPYATLVLSGGYEEAGDHGRFRVAAGDVLFHGPFAAHRDRVANRATTVLDLPLPLDGRAWIGRGSVADPDAVVRLAERDAAGAVATLIASAAPVAACEADLPDLLARALAADPSLSIAGWAARNGYARETVSRAFTRAYGVDAAAYRLEARTREGWRRTVATGAPLAGIAADTGFADQAHMTRAITRLTGRPPAWWRRAVTSVQDGPAVTP